MRKSLGMMLTLSILSFSTYAQSISQHAVDAYFNSIKNDKAKLSDFLFAMPKGADLHSHEAGASFAEDMIGYASKDNLCIYRDTFMVYQNVECRRENLLNQAIKEPNFYNLIIDAWSMRDFNPHNGSGHDHFFEAFDKYGYISGHHHGEMLAEISQRAALQNEQYLELMVTADGNESGQLGKKLGWDPDFNKMRDKLLAANFNQIVKDISATLDADEAKKAAVLRCKTNQPQAGCQLKVRYLYQVLRDQAPEMVFAQLLAGFEAASKDPRIVGINMVQPEDGFYSMRDYALHMQMVGFLHKLYPAVHISLHAGELTTEFAPPSGLTFHIHDAVTVANADRIGHGVDIAQETNADQLLQTMAAKHVLVEINLSSNAQILNVEGKNHPLPLYRQYDVPVALSTDDEGVTRDNLSKEYQLAVSTFQLDYPTLKEIARNSIAYAFLPGKSLWQDAHYHQVVPDCAKDQLGAEHPSALCLAFLNTSEKANSEWELERRFNNFEARF